VAAALAYPFLLDGFHASLALVRPAGPLLAAIWLAAAMTIPLIADGGSTTESAQLATFRCANDRDRRADSPIRCDTFTPPI